tara:strand:- start:26400 stop:26552 length:153 start_codon:yes stop_codon:yes gene_type:complete
MTLLGAVVCLDTMLDACDIGFLDRANMVFVSREDKPALPQAYLFLRVQLP